MHACAHAGLLSPLHTTPPSPPLPPPCTSCRLTAWVEIHPGSLPPVHIKTRDPTFNITSRGYGEVTGSPHVWLMSLKAMRVGCDKVAAVAITGGLDAAWSGGDCSSVRLWLWREVVVVAITGGG